MRTIVEMVILVAILILMIIGVIGLFYIGCNFNLFGRLC